MRIQILNLPTVYTSEGEVVEEPFSLVMDQCGRTPDQEELDRWLAWSRETGARSILVTDETVEIPTAWSEQQERETASRREETDRMIAAIRGSGISTPPTTPVITTNVELREGVSAEGVASTAASILARDGQLGWPRVERPVEPEPIGYAVIETDEHGQDPHHPFVTDDFADAVVVLRERKPRGGVYHLCKLVPVDVPEDPPSADAREDRFAHFSRLAREGMEIPRDEPFPHSYTPYVAAPVSGNWRCAKCGADEDAPIHQDQPSADPADDVADRPEEG
jgi:hypothetical protein